ncbi:procollagen-lysine,2-oxoglutarate 5-dioxygenase 2-like [Mytilus galloprovincialis]|uniref:procollagen-lysine,2-oxoglutarate 5-dioxygenase 2-like n=1 Tax=Mytilus galloprovincialis TaxID=29158 RepID=UPI003F7BDA04
MTLSDDKSDTVFNDDFVTELLAVVITAGETDAEKLRRYELSAETNKIKYKVFDIQQPWRNYDVVVYTEGGYKVNVLKENLEEYTMKENLVILITDSPDSVILDSSKEILKRFKRFDARIVFATDNSCWPKNQIKSQYPSVGTFDNRYLSAGAFIGYAKDIFNMVNHRTINDMESDQLYYSEIFVNNELRSKWNIKLDRKTSFFQNMRANKETLEMKHRDYNYIYNRRFTTRPVIIYDSGPIKGKFLRIADYLTGAWTSSRGCLSCAKNRINLNNFEEDAYPNVQLSVFIDEPTPFITEAMELIGDLDYPKSKMNLFVYVHDEFHYKDVEIFISNVGSEYNSMTIVNHEDKMSVSQARNWALLMCKQRKCDYYFAIEGHVHLTDPRTLKDLIEHNRTVIAPLLVRHNEIWSNFWGARSNDGYYERSDDYIDIVEYVKK